MSNIEMCPWSQFEPAAIEFCEKRLCGWIVEPANTWSNISYLIAAAMILYNNKSRGRLELSLIGWTSMLVGIGSGIFHGTGTRFGEILDVSAMYLISTLFLSFYLRRVFKLPTAKIFAFYAVVASTSILTLFVTRSNGILLFASHIAACVILQIYVRRIDPVKVEYKHLVNLMVGFTVAFIAWAVDVRHLVCDPHNHVLGGHAVWHLSNATCLWSFYKFQEQFFTERKLDQPTIAS